MPYRGETRSELVLHWLGILLFVGILAGGVIYAIIALGTTGDPEQIVGALIAGPIAVVLLVLGVPMLWEEDVKPAREYWHKAWRKSKSRGA